MFIHFEIRVEKNSEQLIRVQLFNIINSRWKMYRIVSALWTMGYALGLWLRLVGLGLWYSTYCHTRIDAFYPQQFYLTLYLYVCCYGLRLSNLKKETTYLLTTYPTPADHRVTIYTALPWLAFLGRTQVLIMIQQSA